MQLHLLVICVQVVLDKELKLSSGLPDLWVSPQIWATFNMALKVDKKHKVNLYSGRLQNPESEGQ